MSVNFILYSTVMDASLKKSAINELKNNIEISEEIESRLNDPSLGLEKVWIMCGYLEEMTWLQMARLVSYDQILRGLDVCKKHGKTALALFKRDLFCERMSKETKHALLSAALKDERYAETKIAPWDKVGPVEKKLLSECLDEIFCLIQNTSIKEGEFNKKVLNLLDKCSYKNALKIVLSQAAWENKEGEIK